MTNIPIIAIIHMYGLKRIFLIIRFSSLVFDYNIDRVNLIHNFSCKIYQRCNARTYYNMIYAERDSICYSNLIQILYYAFDNVYGKVIVLFIDPIIDVKRSMSR